MIRPVISRAFERRKMGAGMQRRGTESSSGQPALKIIAPTHNTKEMPNDVSSAFQTDSLGETGIKLCKETATRGAKMVKNITIFRLSELDAAFGALGTNIGSRIGPDKRTQD